MDPISIIAILISSGLLTELVKWIADLTKTPVPKNLIPALSTAIGAAGAVGVSAAVPDHQVSAMAGAIAGLAGTGGHQLLFAHRYVKLKPNTTGQKPIT